MKKFFTFTISYLRAIVHVMEITDKPQMCWFSSEMLAAYQFCRQSYLVSVPLSPCPYDLLIDNGQKVLKIQVKRAKYVKQRMRKLGLGDRDHWELQLTRKTRRKRKAGTTGHERINLNAFDYLVVVCHENLIYVIPAKELESGEYPGQMLRIIHFKPPIEGDGRADSIKAGQRWEPFKNNFVLA